MVSEISVSFNTLRLEAHHGHISVPSSARNTFSKLLEKVICFGQRVTELLLTLPQFSKVVLIFFTVSAKKGIVMFYHHQNITSANPSFLCFE